MELTEEEKEMIEGDIKKLLFVNWDRYFKNEDGDIDVFGWIDREDSYKDFVVFNYLFKTKLTYQFGFTTSSAKFSKQISELLGLKGHVECQRVEDITNILNVIRLK